MGQYRTLDEALNEVDEFSTIFISEGVYTLKQPIKKRGLIFERRDTEKKVYIIGSEGPTIKIELAQEDYVVFKKIIIMHSGSQVGMKFNEANVNEPKYCQLPKLKTIKQFEIHHDMDCLLMVISGGVMLRDCTLTLRSMPMKLKCKYPCIVTMPKTFLNMTSCEVLGTLTNHNAAGIFINSHVFVSDCKFTDFKAGCIYSFGKPHNMVSI